MNTNKNIIRAFYYCFFALISFSIVTHAGENSKLIRSLQEQTEQSGKIELEFSVSKNKLFKYIAADFEKSGNIAKIIDKLNRDFIFPVNIPVIFADQDGPLYDSETKTISMSYDFIAYLAKLYLQDYPEAKKEEVVTFIEDSTIFFLYHELAHALIDIYQLPVVSNEETAADNLAIILALEYTVNGYDIVMNTANLFDMLDRTSNKYQEDDLWDEHSLDAQRFYNIICLTYGKDPKTVKKELKELDNKLLLKFIGDRGDYCIREYHRQYDSWMTLLDVHFTE